MRALKAVLQVLLGLTLGLGLAELVFSWRDDGAFPHLNLYQEDPKLGVQLQPNAQMRLRVADNDVTTVKTNEDGFRAPDWPQPTQGEVLVVGDSQVFGLGVEQEETFSAKLAELLKVPVLNAGVPTYGPREYTAVVEQTLGRRKVGTVVYVLNLSNDLFEVDRPNLERHAVWDGWAVRRETAPAEVTSFPFRRALMSRSHLVFALRKWLHSAGQPSEGFATEGTWKDVVQASSGVQPLPPEDAAARALLEARAALSTQLDDVAQKLEHHLEDKVDEDDGFAEAVRPLAPRGGDPRDILEVRYAEGARRVDQTAYHLFMAAVGERRNEAFLEKLAASKKDPRLLELINQRKALREQLDALKPAGEAVHALPIETVLAKTRAACDKAGARLLVVALPLDVMVSAEEWKKYGVPPLDMTPTRVLTEDMVTRAQRLGALALDATPALAAAEPGAFLKGDLHLTAKGHAALARAIADTLAAPPKPAQALTLPEGRSWPPTEDEWRREGECVVKGSSAAGCETKRVREWLRVRCLPGEEEGRLALVELQEGGHGDARAWVGDGETWLIPIVEGDTVRARFAWEKVQRTLQADFPKGGALTMAFTAPVPRVKPRGEPARMPYQAPPMDPLRAVGCPTGQVPGGALRACAPACDAATPCAAGHCEPWPSGSFCAVP